MVNIANPGTKTGIRGYALQEKSRPNRAAGRLVKTFAAISASVLALTSVAHANPKMVIDVRTGKVISHQEAFRKWYPASLTKLMTAYIAFSAMKSGKLSPTTEVVMSKKAADQPASKMYFKPGSKLSLDSALKLLLIKSANDVAVAIAETVGGTTENFVAQMNAQAARLGMSSTHYVNPNGLPGKGQYTTARDLAVLALILKREFPEYAGYFALEGVSTGKKNYANYNMLVGRFQGADGMKTGFICASGFNQVSSATRNGRQVISVVLGADSLAGRTDQSADLLQMGLTAPTSQGVSIASLAPYGETQFVNDVSADICNPKAAKVRSESRDDAGRMIIKSPFVQEMTRPPVYSYAGLIPGSETLAANTTARDNTANVPIPIPRPTF
ncbi:D-alanyl-D-alanine carboxypeptidase family protein [Rhizobium skierniewicense]|uniref:D-alanyl-D-alanine carboxypeptidase family protein n=1 Tax=Rhizobium skierniewicense TaxID=984260 RepID=UPI00157476C1|nr:D-alanyl-D-alanine carboxypeptidase family protein [Rhizobium skierniewicense]NTF33895.1 D-alanyl-D-alanine carboxypeptidase [Rhizobium skierniewicense]